jgi:hypothetical protein
MANRSCLRPHEVRNRHCGGFWQRAARCNAKPYFLRLEAFRKTGAFLSIRSLHPTSPTESGEQIWSAQAVWY